MSDDRWWGGMFDHPSARPAPDYAGLSVEQANALARERGVTDIREWPDPAPEDFGVTADLRPARLNFVVRDGTVLEAASF